MTEDAMTILHRGVMDTIRETMVQLNGTPDDMITLMEAMAAEAIVNLAKTGNEDQLAQSFGESVCDLVNEALQKKATAH